MAKHKFVKGNNAASGRGPNKITRTVKETVLAVFTEIQSDPKVKLSQFAKDYPKEFYAIAAKLIPTEVQATVESTVTWNETKTYETKPKTDHST